jgi:hypothetical protein
MDLNRSFLMICLMAMVGAPVVGKAESSGSHGVATPTTAGSTVVAGVSDPCSLSCQGAATQQEYDDCMNACIQASLTNPQPTVILTAPVLPGQLQGRQ